MIPLDKTDQDTLLDALNELFAAEDEFNAAARDFNSNPTGGNKERMAEAQSKIDESRLRISLLKRLIAR